VFVCFVRLVRFVRRSLRERERERENSTAYNKYKSYYYYYVTTFQARSLTVSYV